MDNKFEKLRFNSYRFDGHRFDREGILEESKYDHGETRGLAIYQNKILTTGGNDSKFGNKTELLDLTNYVWSDAADFPAM